MTDRIVLWSGGDREPDDDLNVVVGEVRRVMNVIGTGRPAGRSSSLVMSLERQLDQIVSLARATHPAYSTGR